MGASQRMDRQRLAKVALGSIALWLVATIALFVYLDRMQREDMLEADAILIPLVAVSTLLGGVLLVSNAPIAAVLWLQARKRATKGHDGE